MSAVAWTDVSTALPDDDILVLIAMDDGEVWPGVHDYGRWIYVSGAEVKQTVTHRMHLPAARSRKLPCDLSEAGN